MNSNLRLLLALGVVAACFFSFEPRVPAAAAHTYTGNYVGPVTFNGGDTLTAAQLNQAISHCHNTFGNISDAHLSSSAAISHTKLATPSLVPKAMALVLGGSSGAGPFNWTACTTGTCTLAQSARVTSVTWASAGVYHVTLSYTPSDATFMVQALATQNTNNIPCRAYDFNASAPHFKIACGTGGVTDSAVAFTVWDSSN